MCERAGVLHSDVSVGNILIVDDPAAHNGLTGVIHDFDYSCIWGGLKEGENPTMLGEGYAVAPVRCLVTVLLRCELTRVTGNAPLHVHRPPRLRLQTAHPHR